MRGAMATMWRRMRESVMGGGGGSRERLVDEDESVPTRSLSTDYTELMGGTVPCPSCKGTGRIPKEMEETLVALIPVNDDRLKPKHTWRWVLIVVIACLAIASGVIFMLVPRAVELQSRRPSIDRVHIIETSKEGEPSRLKFHFMNYVNISNANYYAVEVQNTTAMITSKFQPWSTEEIGSGANATVINVSPLNQGRMTPIGFNSTVELTKYVAEYCTAPFSRLTSLYVNMQFDISVSLIYFNHREQITLSTIQQVCCVPTGNCTTPY